MLDPRYASLLTDALSRLDGWREAFGPFDVHPSMQVDETALREALERYTDRLTGNYPFFHPRYAGQMLKPPHPAAWLGYALAATINPNNHALDGGPPTSAMEKELMPKLGRMFGFETPLGHLTSSGTVANLEALYIAREETPGRGIAVSAAGHYTHTRMAKVLGVEAAVIPTDARDRMDLDALEAALKTGRIGTVVATAGTTGLGAVDAVDEIVPLAWRYGARVHVDAAYGGFFSILARAGSDLLDEATRRAFVAIEDADSVVVDPHKHGLQPYGCGAVLFNDPAVARHYLHDSPYTYFTSDDLHLGEISLECSRAGAAAGALWLTLELLPLEAERGFGPVLAACLRAARTFADAVDASERLRLVRRPTLDLVGYFPAAPTASEVSHRSTALFDAAMSAPPGDAVFVALYATAADRLPGVTPDEPTARVLRSVLMKPEHEAHAAEIVQRLDGWAGA